MSAQAQELLYTLCFTILFCFYWHFACIVLYCFIVLLFLAALLPLIYIPTFVTIHQGKFNFINK